MHSLADIRQQGHEPRPLQRGGDGPLEGGAIAGPLAAEQLALTRAKLLEALHVLVIDERGPRTAFFRAKPTPILPATAELFPHHDCSLIPLEAERFSRTDILAGQ